MKTKRFFITLLAIIATILSIVGLCACRKAKKDGYTITVDTSKPFVVEVGDTIDYKQYFTVTDRNGNQIVVTDRNGNQIVVTDAMLDTSKADTSKEGQFTITLTVGNVNKDLTFTVKNKGDGASDDLNAIFAKYADESKWNFAVKVLVTSANSTYQDYYEYHGNNILFTFEDDNGGEYTDYLGYNASAKTYTYYYDNGNGTYTTYAENTDDFEDNYYNMNLIYLSELSDYEFVAANGGYTAKLPNAAGNAVLGEFEDSTWTAFTLSAANGNITKMVGVTSDGYTFTYEFSKHGTVSFKLPGTGSSDDTTEPTGTMENQTYDAATFDRERLQDKLTKTGDYPDPAIGLPSTGTYHALVIPVQFGNTEISQEQLGDLNIAFNGTEKETGWESVKTYYQKASYGKLNLSFDIAGYNIEGVDFFTTNNEYSHYEDLKETDEESGEQYHIGDNVLLHEVLAYYQDLLDLTKYDTNDGDDAIDAIYLIYSAPVDYNDDSFYWAYVTWDYEETKYDEKDAYYYLFAGFGFMYESVQDKNTNSDYPIISGLKVNASTYIHETGHLLGLDDYYDYYPDEGSNEGLGGADMMDATVGDQNVYSKMMLGWLTPQIITSTATVTIQSSQAAGDAILVPLNFNNSYFCEYLLIDLYSAQGLNALHASMSNSYLYDRASYGVRIYHVSSWIEKAYDNDFGSFTDNNNSMSDTALIKLVEADGETKFASSDGYAAESDLWQAGDKLSTAFPSYTRNDGKSLNFDIAIVSVSATQATITITYNA